MIYLIVQKLEHFQRISQKYDKIRQQNVKIGKKFLNSYQV
jgi:hypothetical protein